jgi:propanol-preferring alcohol dehydrogenase
MRALRLMEWKSEPVLTEVPDPVPTGDAVVVRVGGAGACHSDLHLMHDFEPGTLPWKPPFTLGHENAGWVHTLGPMARGVEVGQPVAVVGAWGCGHCAHCRAGLETYCESPADAPVPMGGGGLGLDGGMAELLLVPSARHLVPLPDGLAPAVAAPLTDAALTPYHAVRRSLPKLTPDATALVLGVGGLGHLAIQILRAVCAARMVAVDPRAAARDLATRAGADAVLDPGEGGTGQGGTGEGGAGEVSARVRDLTGGRGADVVLDLVGSDQTLRTGAAAGRMLGDLTVVGLGGGTLPVSFFSLPYELSVQTTYWGNRGELVEVLELAARGLLRPEVTTVDLDHAAQTYRRLASRELTGRAVVVPSPEP